MPIARHTESLLCTALNHQCEISYIKIVKTSVQFRELITENQYGGG